jgi:hypothetical protein
MDESGEHMSDYDHEVYKERLDPNGKPITKEVLRGIFRFMCKKKTRKDALHIHILYIFL